MCTCVVLVVSIAMAGVAAGRCGHDACSLVGSGRRTSNIRRTDRPILAEFLAKWPAQVWWTSAGYGRHHLGIG